MSYWVYIMCSRRNGTLYVGVTNDIARRVYEHKNGLTPGFTEKYAVHHLVYIEEYGRVEDAIHREKCLKRWKRAWKIRLIEDQNPLWTDYFEGMSVLPTAAAGLGPCLRRGDRGEQG